MSIIADTIAEKAGLTKTASAELAKSILEAITDKLAAGETVVLNNFGRLSVKETAARKGRNPRTGEELDIPAGRKVSFSPSSVLKDRVK